MILGELRTVTRVNELSRTIFTEAVAGVGYIGGWLHLGDLPPGSPVSSVNCQGWVFEYVRSD